MAKERKQQANNVLYAIEKIVAYRRGDRGFEYLIQWKDGSEQSWQSVEDLVSKKRSMPEAAKITPKSESKVFLIESSESSSEDDIIIVDPKDVAPMPTRSKRRIEPAKTPVPAQTPVPAKRRNTNTTQNNGRAKCATNSSVKNVRSLVRCSTPKIQEKQIETVQDVRKRNEQIEYLVKWHNHRNMEWISHSIAITKYHQEVIAYYQASLTFRN